MWSIPIACWCFQLIILLAVSIVGIPIDDSSPFSLCTVANEVEDDGGVCVDPRTCPAFQEINHVEMVGNTSRLSFIRELQCDEGMICCPLRNESYQKPWMLEEVQPRVRFDIKSRSSIDDDSECGSEAPRYRIMKGDITAMDEFPWTALLMYKRMVINCGGVLISRNFVITAAHCLVGKSYIKHPLEIVRLREYNKESDPDCLIDSGYQDCIEGGKLDKKPLSIKVHPDYDPHYAHHHHDIGLVEINLTEEYSDFLRPICLPEEGRLTGLDRDQYLTVCGWGKTNFFQAGPGIIPSPVKLKAKLPFVEPDKCRASFVNLQLGPGQICAGGNRKDSCAGDSGSPLKFYDRSKAIWVLSGIVSTGTLHCGTKGKPGIYTNVEKYLPWIKKITGM